MKYRALITGATGFVGGYAAECLHAAGWHVSAIVRSTSRRDLLPPTVRDNVQFYDADQMPLLEIVGAAAPDVVFHLATYYTTVHSPEEIDALIAANITFGTKLLDGMAQHGVQNFVYARSSWQHYHGDVYEPVNLYAASKEAFDAMVRFYESAYDLHTIRLTLFDTYGENDRRNKLLAVLPKLAAQGKRLALSKGEQHVDFVHVKDAARAFLLAGQYLAEGHIEQCGNYVVSSGHAITLKELVHRYENLLGVKFPVDWGEKPYRAREVMMPWRGGRILPGWERMYKELM